MVLELLLDHAKEQLGVKGLACLAATTRDYRSTCHAHARLNCVWLIDQELNQAQGRRAQQERALVWLASVARNDPNAERDVAEQLLSLKLVSPNLAAELIRAGVRVTYAQLLAAAKRGVTGVEVWVQALQQVGGTTDMPAIAVAICCDGDWVSCITVKVIAMAGYNGATASGVLQSQCQCVSASSPHLFTTGS
jgi:hypothetical protein